MAPIDYVVNLTISAFLIVGIYQAYFWCQRMNLATPRQLRLRIDDQIPYWPRWSWVYSCLYYPVILYINAVMTSSQHFMHVAMSYVVLLAMQTLFFLFFPVVTPPEWRELNQRNNLSERFLAFIQRFDAPSNSFPSMHVSVAMLTALHLQAYLGAWAFVFPVLIGISCLFTKQHYLSDLPAGAVLGWFAHYVYTVAL
jgi:membrane-associated phospholipid phosphatase